MIRKLKTLGLALVAVLALSAVAASAASAVTTDGELTSDGPVKQDGTEIAGKTNAITSFGESIQCPGTTAVGEAVGGGFIKPPITTATITVFFSTNCTTTGPHKVTVTTNGCDFVFHLGETVGVDEYAETIDLVCPVGKQLEAHVYLATNNENVVVCTIKIKAQTGLTGGTIASDTTNDDLVVGGRVNGIHIEREGLCGAGTTTEGEVHLNFTVKGTNEAGSPTGMTITH